MSAFQLKYSPYGSEAILIEWPKQMTSDIQKDIIYFKNKIENKYIKQKLELIPAYNSLLVVYSFTIENINGEISALKQIYNSKITSRKIITKHWKIPVCYDLSFGRDLELLSVAKNLSVSEIIQQHTAPIYTIAFIGFLPGFLYLNGLDKNLCLDRKSTPNLNIKKGTVAIGGMQTGIYPKQSPGGWHSIGNTPVDLFNIAKDPPSPFKAGDTIKFISIDLKTHQDILQKVKSSNYHLTPALP